MSIPPKQQQQKGQKGKRDTVVEVLATMSSRKLWKGGSLSQPPLPIGRGASNVLAGVQHAVRRAGQRENDARPTRCSHARRWNTRERRAVLIRVFVFVCVCVEPGCTEERKSRFLDAPCCAACPLLPPGFA